MAEAVRVQDGRGTVTRAIGWGCGCGAVSGGIVGTLVVPILGTAIGGAVGAVIGLCFGVLNGLALAALGPGTSRSSARVVAGLVSAGCGVAAFALVPGHLLVDLGFVGACALIGAVVGPAARFGLVRPGRSATGVVGRGLVFGISAGGLIGAVAGLVIGLFSYVPTAAAALVEGSVIGALIGAVVGLVGGAGTVLMTSRIR